MGSAWRLIVAVIVCSGAMAACGSADEGAETVGVDAVDPTDDNEVADQTDDSEVDGDDESDGGGVGPMGGEMATLRMINLVRTQDGGVDVDVVGPAEDFTSDYVYGTVAYGSVAEIEFPVQWDASLVRAGTTEAVGGSITVFDDTEPGRVVAFRDDGASTFGAFVEDRKDGFATVGMVSAIADPDPNRRYRYSSPDGVCLFSVGDQVPAPMATAAEGGDTRGILSTGLVDDFVWYIEAGPQEITHADAAADVFTQGDDCSSKAFSADIDAVEGKAVFIAFYGDSSDVRSTVYYEQ